jgi:hypothetical protein
MDFERLERSGVVVFRERLGILAARFERKSARKVVCSNSVLIELVRLVITFSPKLIVVMALGTTTRHFGDIAVYREWHQVFTSVTQVQDPTAFIRRGETSC